MDNRSNNEKNEINNNDEFNDMLSEYYNQQRKKKWADQLATEHSIFRDRLNRPNRPRRRMITYISSIAATAIILFVVNTVMDPFGPSLPVMADNMLKDTPLTLSGDMSIRGHLDSSNVNKEIEDALESKDYTKAIALYEQGGLIENLSTSGKFYLGVSHAKSETGDLSKGIELLSEIAEGESAYQLDAKWFLALSYLKNGDTKQGETVLKELLASSDYQTKNVKNLLREIK